MLIVAFSLSPIVLVSVFPHMLQVRFCSSLENTSASFVVVHAPNLCPLALIGSLFVVPQISQVYVFIPSCSQVASVSVIVQS